MDPEQEILNLTQRRNSLLTSFQLRRVVQPVEPQEPQQIVPQEILNEPMIRAMNECPPSFHEVAFLTAEKKLRLKIYGNLINDEVDFDANNIDANEEEICNHFGDEGISDQQLCNFLLHKVSSLPLGPNLLYEIPNFFQHNPNLLQGIFRQPRIYITYPRGEDFTDDNIKVPLRLRNGKWVMKPNKIKIRAQNRIVGNKKIGYFQYDPSAGGRGINWFIEIFRFTQIHPVLHFDVANLKIGWAIVRLHDNEEDISTDHINIDDIVQNLGQQN